MTQEQQGEVNFDPSSISIIEKEFADMIARKIKKRVWSDNYFDSYGQRKFSIQFSFGSKYEIRAALSTKLLIIIRNINVLKGGQTSLLDPKVQSNVITILEKLSRSIKNSDLVLRRDLLRYKEEAKKWTRSVFTYEIPPEFLFQVPSNETEVTKYDYTITMTIKDLFTKREVTITGHNELPELLAQRARGKLYIFRELQDSND